MTCSSTCRMARSRRLARRTGEIVPRIDRNCGACGASFLASASVNLCRECGATLTDRG